VGWVMVVSSMNDDGLLGDAIIHRKVCSAKGFCVDLVRIDSV
jgi:hypothetical protein